MKQFQVNYDIIPANGIITQALAFNVAALSGIWELSGHTAFTSHFQILNINPSWADIVSANIRLCIGGPGCQGQLVSMSYDAQGQQVWENVGALMTCPVNVTVGNVSADILSWMTAWKATNTQRNMSLKVKGNGKLYEARLEVVYAIPDGASPTGPLTPEQVEQVLDAAAARVAGD